MTLDEYVAGLGPLPGLLTLVGLGDGALLDALDRSGWQGRIVAFEPVADLKTTRESRASYHVWISADRLRVVEGPAYHGAIDALLAYSGAELRAIAEPSFCARFPDDTRLALDAMAKAVRGVSANAESKRRHAGIYRRNTLFNAPVLAEEGDVAALAGVARDIPVVIAAAGPSLDRQLDALRDAQQRALIISVDTALRPLLAAGIKPHLAVAVDATPTNAMHLVDLTGAESTALVAEGSVDPHALAAFRGRIFGCRISRHDPWPWLEAHGLSVGQLRAWGSVVTTAFDLALHMGARTIALAGVDLAFTEGRPYCRGTSFEEQWRRIEDWGTPMAAQWHASVAGWTRIDEIDVNDRPCQTAPHLVSFRDWMVEQAALASGVRVINVSGEGILKGPSIEQRSLSSLVTEWPAINIRSQLQGCWAPRIPVNDAIAQLAQVSASEIRTEVSTDDPPAVTWRQPDPVTMPRVRMTMPRHRIHRRIDGAFAFTFRTRAARRWMANTLIGEPRVFEADTALVDCNTFDELAAAPAGHFATMLDEIAFKPTGDDDPRFDGPEFAVEVPQDIVNYESLPLDLILRHGL